MDQALQVTQLQVKNFRCFSQATFEFSSPITLIDGVNGSGKTSLLEALHYLCYLRSFRTHTPRELVHFGQDGFFIKGSFTNDHAVNNEIQVGFSNKKRLVKVNKKAVCSYKELMDHYRVVTLTEDDLGLIKGGPDGRRLFIDQALLLQDPTFLTTIRTMKKVLDNRNKLLQSGSIDQDSYQIWTQQLWEQTRAVQKRRNELLGWFEKKVNELLKKHFKESLKVAFTYKSKKIGLESTYEDFLASEVAGLKVEELRYGRSLFGAHLDDFTINFQDRRSKTYASRGQQKLIAVLLKVAQMCQLAAQKGPSIFLLDDFMTDFDENRVEILLSIMGQLNNQLIFTTPAQKGFLEQKLLSMGGHCLKLTNRKDGT